MSITAEQLSDLCAEAKKEAARARIDRENDDRSALYALLASDAPKTRKNAARLLGALHCRRDAQALTDALASEDTLFAIPSMLLALGSIGGDAADAALDAYAVPAPRDETEIKHVAEIADALKKARAARTAGAPIAPYALLQARPLLCCAPDGFSDLLCEELTALGYAPEPADGGCLVTARDWEALYRARCMSELLIPLRTQVPADADAVAEAARGELNAPYRIELRGYTGDRAAFLRGVAASCGGENNPSHYALELRVLCTGSSCALYLKPSYTAERWRWRKRAISASMQPPLAACLSELAKKYAPEHPRVFDPCCGSGTLLFSCEDAFPCASLIGTDVSSTAISAARENAAAGRSRARFIQKDALRFVPNEPVDLVISNLPFGNRVGSHEENRALYAAFIRRLPKLLSPDGVALLYTMEYRLLSGCIKSEPRLSLVNVQRTEAGGLCPWVFLLRTRSDGAHKSKENV